MKNVLALQKLNSRTHSQQGAFANKNSKSSKSGCGGGSFLSVALC